MVSSTWILEYSMAIWRQQIALEMAMKDIYLYIGTGCVVWRGARQAGGQEDRRADGGHGQARKGVEGAEGGWWMYRAWGDG
jgi:hypothetical protein